MTTIIAEYDNGNTHVQIFNNGTKIRTSPDNESVNVVFPETIDCKITNFCDAGCSYCHEKADENGKDADLTILLDVIKELPAGVELAIGANTLSHSELYTFLQVLKQRGIIANITVNQRHLYKPILQTLIKEDLVKGIGISYTSKAYTKDIQTILKLSPHVVFHIINGINKPEDVDDLIEINNQINPNSKTKILLLGYKDYGRGSKYLLQNDRIEKIKQQWLWKIRSVLDKNIVMSFDNLAIEQVRLKRFFPEKEWNKFYMGEEFVHSMYIDAVEQKFAPTSTNPNKVSFQTKSLFQYFQDKN